MFAARTHKHFFPLLFAAIAAFIILVVFYMGAKAPSFPDVTPLPSAQSTFKPDDASFRDQQRQAQLQMFQLALNAYHVQYGRYPLPVGAKISLATENKNLAADFKAYHPGIVEDPLMQMNSLWPQPVYWQVSSTKYVLFAELEEMKSVKMKLSPVKTGQMIETYLLTFPDKSPIEYNYWISNDVQNVPIKNSPGPSPSPTSSSTPKQATPPVQPKSPAQKSSKLRK